jgi:hypothetical protein
MPVKEQDFQNKMKQALMNKPDLSAESKALFFTQAEMLLAKKRERRNMQESAARVRLSPRKTFSRYIGALIETLAETLAIQPDVPAAGAAFLALILAFLAFHGSHSRFNATYSEFPDFPKNNDSQARYDAERLAEQQAYEREVEDAHKNTSGGL